MQPLDALTLWHYAAELDVKLADGKINKIQQPSHHELLLHLWVGGQASRQKLYINIRPEYAFCALVEDSSFVTVPALAPNFCMVLRKHLTSARITRVSALPDERVLNIEMDNYNELGQEVQLVLSLELMGKNSNIILYHSDINMIIGCAHGVSEHMSREREISVGYPYMPPPKPPRHPIRTIVESEFVSMVSQANQQQTDPAERLTREFVGTGKAVLTDVLTAYPDPYQAYRAFKDLVAGDHLSPMIRRDFSRFSLVPAHQQDPDWMPMGSLTKLVQTYYLHHLLTQRLSQKRTQLSQALLAQKKKVQKRLQELERSSPEVIERLKTMGDLLTIAHSQQQTTPGNRIELQEFSSGESIAIELDPTLSLLENAQLYYRRYKKAQARQQMAMETGEQLTYAQDYMETLLVAVQNATQETELDEIRQDMVQQGWVKPLETQKKGQKQQRAMPLSLVSSDGFTILVGRNGLQNDMIVGKLSRTEDLWLHTHLIPGSHVLIKSEKRAIPDSTLAEAAMVAVYYSQGRDSVNVPVVYTEARYVRKIPNSYPGHVTYTHEKSVNMTVDPEVINRLMVSEVHQQEPDVSATI